MKIYSWNVYCFNRTMPEVARHIETLDFDVLCLQEVTPALLERLKALPYHLTYHVDVLRLLPGNRREYNYVAILSKRPFVNTGTMQFFDFPFPFHTRVFVSLMSFFEWSFITERGAVYADIEENGSVLRIFSVHLTLWGPVNRVKEFDVVADHIQPGAPAVVCGDFNIIEYAPMKILNWILGAPLREGMPWYPERDLFEERFARVGLRNPLRAQITHPFSRSQLDHILVSEELRTKDPTVYLERHGSDHQLVSVELLRETD